MSCDVVDPDAFKAGLVNGLDAHGMYRQVDMPVNTVGKKADSLSAVDTKVRIRGVDTE